MQPLDPIRVSFAEAMVARNPVVTKSASRKFEAAWRAARNRRGGHAEDIAVADSLFGTVLTALPDATDGARLVIYQDCARLFARYANARSKELSKIMADIKEFIQ